MPDRYRDILTGSGVWIALFASLGGCVLRYLEEYKHEKKWHCQWRRYGFRYENGPFNYGV